MKIGLFTNAYHPTINGVVHAVSLLFRGMEELGHSVYVFAPGFKGYKDENPNVRRFWSINLFPKNKYPLAIPFNPGLIGFIKDLNLDIIHAHHPYLLGKLGARIGRERNIPVIYTFHTQFEQYVHYIPLVPKSIGVSYVRNSVIDFLKRCNRVICPSPVVLPILEDYGVKVPVEVVPNPVDLSAFGKSGGAEVREKYGISHDENILIYVGRLGREKSLPELFRAFKKILESRPDTRLMVIGEGPYREALENEVKKLNLDGKIILTGRVEPGDLPPYYAAADVYVMSSTSEVKPLALLEAIASRLPVVAVRGAGASDTITHGEDGLLVDDASEPFVSAVLELLGDPDLRKKMGESAGKNSAKYNYINISKKTLEVYERARDALLP